MRRAEKVMLMNQSATLRALASLSMMLIPNPEGQRLADALEKHANGTDILVEMSPSDD